MPINVHTDANNNINIDVNTTQANASVNLLPSGGGSRSIGTTPLFGPTGNGIASIELTSTSGLVDTYTITYTNGNTTTFNVTNGADGTDGTNGNGIVSIEKTGTSGLVDTYTITYTDGNSDTFTVTNGQDGQDGQDGADGQDGVSPTATVTKSGDTATITITDANGTTTATITDGQDGTNGQDGAAATISVGTVQTGAAGSSASVTNSGTSSAAVFDFTIPKGDKGDTGNTGADGYSPTATVTKSGDTATITITDKNGTTTATVSDGSGASSISQLTDVDLTGLSNGDTLIYNSTSQEWEAGAGGGGGTIVVDQTFDGSSINPQSGVAIAGELANYTPTSGLATVATTGSYTSLTNRPTIGDGTIIIKEGTTEKGRFTLNQTGDTTVNLTQVGAGMITFMQDGLQSGRVSANRATDTTITLKGLYDYESVNADMIGNNLVQANNNRVTGFSANDYIEMREPITLPQYWEYDVDFSIIELAYDVGEDQYIFSDKNNTFALKENEDSELFDTFTLYVNGTPVASNIEAESAYYNIKFIKGMDENYNIVGNGDTLQCYVYVGYSSGQSTQKELVGSFTSSVVPTTVQTIFGVNSNHTQPLSDDSYIDFTKCFIDGITISGNTVTKTRIWDGLVRTIDTKVNTWECVKSVNNELPDANGNVTIQAGGSSRNIGEIVTSTIPLTDAGLHLLDGALISGSGSYSDFVDYIADLYDSGNYSDIFETEANWQTAVTTYGVCGKFVYDSVNDTVRLPKLGSLVYTTNDNTASIIPVSVYGTGKALGLTDGSTLAGLQNLTSSSAHQLYARVESYDTSVGTTASGSTNYLSSTSVGVTTDATKSGLTGNANTSNIIVNNSVNCYYYIVVAISTNTQIQVDIDEIATDLNGKADVDLSNITQGCKVLDGQWVNSALTVADGASCPATSASVPTYDLSSYLPNDNYNYEVLFDVAVTTGTTSGNFSRVNLCSDLITNDTDVCYVRTRSSSSVNAAGNCILAVGTGRSISLGYYSSNTGTYTLRARGYRRIGTNT